MQAGPDDDEDGEGDEMIQQSRFGVCSRQLELLETGGLLYASADLARVPASRAWPERGRFGRARGREPGRV